MKVNKTSKKSVRCCCHFRKETTASFLLYCAGEEICEIFETLADTGDHFKTAKEKLTEYFEPKKNIENEIYTIRQAKQNPLGK